MNRGRLAGFLSGLGSAAADAVYGTAAAFGASVLSEFLLVGFYRADGAVILAIPDQPVHNGAQVG